VRQLVDSSREATHLKPEPELGASAPDGQPWRRLVSVDGFQTEVYGIHHVRPGGARLKVVVLPGNPGQAAYYLPLLAHLHEQLGGVADVLAVSHKGHGIDCRCEQAFSLQEQIEHKVAFIEEFCLAAEQGSPGIMLVGHSIGAYMALHAAKVIEDRLGSSENAEPAGDEAEAREGDAAPGAEKRHGRLAKVVGVFPFLGVDSRGSTRQSFLRGVSQVPQVMAAAGAALGLLPQGLRHSVIRLCGGSELQEHAVDSTGMLLRYWNCYNAFYLAKTEFADLEAPPDWDLIRRLGDRAAMIVCPNDMWAPDWMMEEMQAEVPALPVIRDTSMVHGFCVSDVQSRGMAAHLAGLLPAVWDSQR